MNTKTKHGGKREGAGPPLKYGEPMKMISVKVPESKIMEIKSLIKNKLKSYLAKKP